jgi:hypothetical protein
MKLSVTFVAVVLTNLAALGVAAPLADAEPEAAAAAVATAEAEASNEWGSATTVVEGVDSHHPPRVCLKRCFPPGSECPLGFVSQRPSRPIDFCHASLRQHSSPRKEYFGCTQVLPQSPPRFTASQHCSGGHGMSSPSSIFLNIASICDLLLLISSPVNYLDSLLD